MSYQTDADALATKFTNPYISCYATCYNALKQLTLANNLIPLVRANPVVAHITVSRNQYDSFLTNFIDNQAVDAAIVDGPTGCGKSTMNLLAALKRNTRILHCSPIDFIRCGVFQEFDVSLPRLIKAGNLTAIYPEIRPCLTDLEDDAVITSPLALTTYNHLAEFIKRNSFLPPFDVIVLDEYHAEMWNVVFARNLIYVQFPDIGLQTRFALISATPPGKPPKLPIATSLQLAPTTLPSPSTRPIPNMFQLNKHAPLGVNLLLIPCETAQVAKDLARDLAATGNRAVVAHEDTTFAEATVIYKSDLRQLTICAVRLACTGVTFPFSHIVNSGFDQVLVYDNSVLRYEQQQLTLPMAAQVHGRGGRNSSTVVYYDCAPGAGVAQTQASDVLRAVAMILFKSVVGFDPPPTCVELDSALNLFPKVKSLNPRALGVCMAHANPLMRAYEIDANGDEYVEYGGTATTLVHDCAQAVKFFKTPHGTFFGLLLDLTIDYNPTRAMSPAVTQALAEEAAKQSNLPQLTMEAALRTIAAKWDQLGQQLWDAFAMFHDSTVVGVVRSSHFAGSDGTKTPSYMFGLSCMPAWNLLNQHGATITEQQDPLSSTHAWRVLSWRSESYIYNPRKKPHWLIPVPNSTTNAVEIDGDIVGRELLARLGTAVTAAALIDDPALSIDLAFLAPHINLNSNAWAREHIQ